MNATPFLAHINIIENNINPASALYLNVLIRFNTS